MFSFEAVPLADHLPVFVSLAAMILIVSVGSTTVVLLTVILTVSELTRLLITSLATRLNVRIVVASVTGGTENVGFEMLADYRVGVGPAG